MKKGFTIIELLVVIAIIGLLTTLAFIALNKDGGRNCHTVCENVSR